MVNNSIVTVQIDSILSFVYSVICFHICLLFILFICSFQCVFCFPNTDYPGPPRLALLPAEPGD